LQRPCPIKASDKEIVEKENYSISGMSYRFDILPADAQKPRRWLPWRPKTRRCGRKYIKGNSDKEGFKFS
jgi:hypothetical protein